MKSCLGTGSRMAVAAVALALCTTSVIAATKPHYVVTNDDGLSANTATFYAIAADGSLSQKKVVKTGGGGIGSP